LGRRVLNFPDFGRESDGGIAFTKATRSKAVTGTTLYEEVDSKLQTIKSAVSQKSEILALL